MDPNMPIDPHQDQHRDKGITPGRVALAVFLLIALFFLLTEHRAHLYGALPYLFLLACPLMHMFHHHGHGGHHRHDGAEGDRK